MDTNKNNPMKLAKDKRLKSYSEVASMDRLSDKDSEIASSLTAGGDKSLINEDINY